MSAAPLGTSYLLAKKRRKPKDGMTPEQAAQKRTGPQADARALLEAGTPAQAGILLDGAAAEQGDPVLFLDAGRAYLTAAKDERDPEMAEASIERARIALDLLYFALDDGADPDFRLVQGADIPALIDRAEELIDDSETTIDEIEAERLAAEQPPPPPEPEKRKVDTVKVLTITGASLTVLGVAALGVGAAGIGLGVVHQQEAESPRVYGEEYDDVAAKGERANLMAYVGLPVAAVLIGGGVAALVIAARKRKAGGGASEQESNELAWGPWMSPGRAGLSVGGRF